MNYFTFQPQFHDLIRQRVKTSTIRGKAKVKLGERFALRYWIGAPYRSKMGTLGTAVCCEVSPIRLWCGAPIEAFIAGHSLSAERYSALAEQEGFGDAAAMSAWFLSAHEMPFHGILTRWDPATFEAAVNAQVKP